MIWSMCKGRGLRFFAPNDGGNSDKGSGDSPTESAVDVEKLFATIPLDELDEPTRKKFEAARDFLKTGVATLQSNLKTTTDQAREFQSQKDQLEAKLKQIQPDPALQTEDDFLKAAKNVMQRNGFTQEQIKTQAPVFAEMLKASSQITTKDFGEHVAPLAGEVIAQQAKSAFKDAQETDEIGYMQIPEVAQKTWDLVKERVEAKAQTNVEIVKNLAKMVYVDYIGDQRKAGKTPADLKPVETNRTASPVNTTYSYPGAGRASVPIVTSTPDPDAPKTRMNADTDSALKQTFRKMTAGHDLKKKPSILEGV